MQKRTDAKKEPEEHSGVTRDLQRPAIRTVEAEDALLKDFCEPGRAWASIYKECCTCRTYFVLLWILLDDSDCDGPADLFIYIRSVAVLLLLSSHAGACPTGGQLSLLDCVMIYHELNVWVTGPCPAMRVSIQRTH